MTGDELLAEVNEALARWEADNSLHTLTEEERNCWRIGYCYGRGVTSGLKEG